ncbi:MAG: hypothetical protein ABR529_04950 [Actinomycetota bacterium]
MWALLVTLWFWLADPLAPQLVKTAQIAFRWKSGQTTFRYAVQLGVLYQILFSSYIAYRLVDSDAAFRAILRGFITGTTASVVLGIYQVAAYRFNWWWIFSYEEATDLRGNFGMVGGHSSLVGPLGWLRLSGLGGEPKHTAAFIVIALCAITSLAFAGRVVASWKIFALLLLGLALTLSTSGWFAFAFAATILAVSGSARFLSPWGTKILVPAQFAAVLAVGGIAFLFILDSQARREIVQTRITERLGGAYASVREFEWKDDALFRFLAENPYQSILGHGMGGVDFYLVRYAKPYITSNSTPTPTYTLSWLIGDIGVVGTFLLVAMLVVWRNSVRRSLAARLFITAAGSAILIQPAFALGGFMLLAGGFLRHGTAPHEAQLPLLHRTRLLVADSKVIPRFDEHTV